MAPGCEARSPTMAGCTRVLWYSFSFLEKMRWWSAAQTLQSRAPPKQARAAKAELTGPLLWVPVQLASAPHLDTVWLCSVQSDPGEALNRHCSVWAHLEDLCHKAVVPLLVRAVLQDALHHAAAKGVVAQANQVAAEGVQQVGDVLRGHALNHLVGGRAGEVRGHSREQSAQGRSHAPSNKKGWDRHRHRPTLLAPKTGTVASRSAPCSLPRACLLAPARTRRRCRPCQHTTQLPRVAPSGSRGCRSGPSRSA